MPDGHIIYSSHTALLPQNTLSIAAWQAHIFPYGMLCDNGCLALFDDKKLTLYMVPLTTKQNEDMTECKIPEHHFAGSLYEAKSKADLSTFLHLACWSPCTSTTTTAIKNNFLSTWPGLTEQLVLKFLPKSEATAKRHIQQSFKLKQSTQPREPSELPSQNPSRTKIVYLQATDLAGEILHRSNHPIPRHIQPRFQVHHGSLRLRLEHDSCQTHEKLQWPRTTNRIHNNPQLPFWTRHCT